MKRKAFTLVELMIVMAIIGILMMGGMAAYRYATKKSRDIARQKAVDNLAAVVEAYYADNVKYPGNSGTINFSQVINNTSSLTDSYDLPNDINNDGPCTSSTPWECYGYYTDSTSYAICACLETKETKTKDGDCSDEDLSCCYCVGNADTTKKEAACLHSNFAK